MWRKKQFLAVALAAVLAAGSIPCSVFAARTEKSPAAASVSLEDISPENETVPEEGSLQAGETAEDPSGNIEQPEEFPEGSVEEQTGVGQYEMTAASEEDQENPTQAGDFPEAGQTEEATPAGGEDSEEVFETGGQSSDDEQEPGRELTELVEIEPENEILNIIPAMSAGLDSEGAQYCEDLETALQYVRELAYARTESIKIQVPETVFQQLDLIGFSDVLSHTGTPQGGDYLVCYSEMEQQCKGNGIPDSVQSQQQLCQRQQDSRHKQIQYCYKGHCRTYKRKEILRPHPSIQDGQRNHLLFPLECRKKPEHHQVRF